TASLLFCGGLRNLHVSPLSVLWYADWQTWISRHLWSCLKPSFTRCMNERKNYLSVVKESVGVARNASRGACNERIVRLTTLQQRFDNGCFRCDDAVTML